MIKQWKIASLISMLILIGSCKDENESFSSFEKKVFDQVFYQVVNGTYRDKRVYEFYCEDGNMVLKNGRYDGYDNPKCNQELEKLVKDTFHLVLAIKDSVFQIPKDEFEIISKEFPVFDSNNYQIDLIKQQTQKFDFKYLSELSKDMNLKNWALKYAKFAGALYFSKIYFAKNKESAVLSVAYFAGPKSGRGYRVYIKTLGDKWVIDKVVDTWIS
jgi:hypothetical protein